MADNILSRGDIIDAVAAQVDLPQTKVDAVLKAFEGAIARQLEARGEVRMAGFGTFKTSHRAARTSRNPRTGEPVAVAERTVARFTPGKGLKEAADSGTAPGKSSAPKKADAKAASGKKAASAKTEAKKPAAKAKKK